MSHQFIARSIDNCRDVFGNVHLLSFKTSGDSLINIEDVVVAVCREQQVQQIEVGRVLMQKTAKLGIVKNLDENTNPMSTSRAIAPRKVYLKCNIILLEVVQHPHQHRSKNVVVREHVAILRAVPSKCSQQQIDVGREIVHQMQDVLNILCEDHVVATRWRIYVCQEAAFELFLVVADGVFHLLAFAQVSIDAQRFVRVQGATLYLPESLCGEGSRRRDLLVMFRMLFERIFKAYLI